MYEPADAVTWTLSRPHGMSRPITSPERFRACSVAPCARFRPAGPRHRHGAASGLRPCWGTSEDRWLRFADEQLRHLFPYLPKQSGYNKRPPRLVATLNWPIGALARDTRLGTDDVWVVESTAADCARSVGRSDSQTWPGGRIRLLSKPFLQLGAAPALVDLHGLRSATLLEPITSSWCTGARHDLQFSR
jgi:hypothetical protein